MSVPISLRCWFLYQLSAGVSEMSVPISAISWCIWDVGSYISYQLVYLRCWFLYQLSAGVSIWDVGSYISYQLVYLRCWNLTRCALCSSQRVACRLFMSAIASLRTNMSRFFEFCWCPATLNWDSDLYHCSYCSRRILCKYDCSLTSTEHIVLEVHSLQMCVIRRSEQLLGWLSEPSSSFVHQLCEVQSDLDETLYEWCWRQLLQTHGVYFEYLHKLC